MVMSHQTVSLPQVYSIVGDLYFSKFSNEMVASKIVIVIFTILFMGFISLLLIFNIYSAVHDSTQVSEIENELVHQKLIFNMNSNVNNSCTFCKTQTLRTLVCSNDTFAIVIGVYSINNVSDNGKQIYFIRVTAEMKSIPLLWESLSRSMIETKLISPTSENCTISLERGREYLVTGSLDVDSLMPKISPCDYIVDWSELQTSNRHRIFAAFNSLKC